MERPEDSLRLLTIYYLLRALSNIDITGFTLGVLLLACLLLSDLISENEPAVLVLTSLTMNIWEPIKNLYFLGIWDRVC